jgi:peptidoglycan hydrolase CwlO-like protein
MIRSLHLRRLLTVVGVVAALLVGYGSIRAAAAWTAASAPLAGAPVPVSTLESRLADEQNRSDALQQQLDALEAQSADLASALQAAQARIDGDASHAKDLVAQLKTAKDRLARLQASIALANRAAQARAASVTVVRTAPTSLPTGGGEPGEGHFGGSDD